MKTFSIFCLLIIITSSSLFSQNKTGNLYGSIKTSEGTALPFALIYIEGAQKVAEADSTGTYTLELRPGSYTFHISAVGLIEQTSTIHIKPGETTKRDFVLKSDPGMNLEEVQLLGKSKLARIKETSFTVDVLDAKTLHSTTLDLSRALESISGIHVRSSGGMGSNYNVMLNGFSGNHVKYFIDGVPMEGFNPAFQLNNIPVDIAERIEVYKGVVPLGLGSDAVGGAINIITNQNKANYLEASYAFGSFNTHKAFVNTGYTTDFGLRTEFSAFLNYSDNDYRVDADIADLKSMKFTGETRRVRRFHDMYRNYSIIGKVGVIDKVYADRLMLGLTYADVYDEIQNPAYMKIAFGQKYGTSHSLMPTLTYKKDNLFTNNLNVSLSGAYNFGNSRNIDDSYRHYNWLGDYIVTDARGEFEFSRRKIKDKNGSLNANVSYTVNDKHTLTIDNVLNSFSRTSTDEATPSAADKLPQKTLKDIFGAGYKFEPNDKFSATLFSKLYLNHVSQYADPDSNGEYNQLNRSSQDLGYGVATSYFLIQNLQLKSSFEKSYRLPTGRELFGVGNSFELGNPDLKPESSNNLNIGLHYNWSIMHHQTLRIDGSFIYRDIKDFIRQIPSPKDGVLKPGNEASVKNRGIDFGLHYNYKQLFSIEGSLTYQDMRNKLKYKNGKDVVSTTYNDRMPNIPYLYGNAGAQINLQNIWNPNDRLQLHYNLLYIHHFDYSYESYGGIQIPMQMSHDVGLNYSSYNGRYNISMDLYNIFNKNLYDNFSLQKPGRHFSIKLRYYLNQF